MATEAGEARDEAAKAAAVRLIEGGLYDEYFKVAFRTSAPLFWYRRDDRDAGGSPQIAAATTFFVNTGAAVFGVTAKHVLERAIEVASDPAIECVLGNRIRFNPRDRMIATSGESDVATFSVGARELAALGRFAHQVPGRWPPPPPEEGKGIFYGGFRGVDRLVEGKTIDFGFAAGAGVATVVDRKGLMIEFDRKSWVCQTRWTPPKEGESWGGASGGPVFAVQKNRGAGRPELFSWRVVGVIAQGEAAWEVIRVHTLWNVNPDGTMAASER